MNNRLTLSDLRPGQTARVISLWKTTDIRQRLQDIGLIEGTAVECLLVSPAGDPVAYLIRGAVIALRAEDAATVLVEC